VTIREQQEKIYRKTGKKPKLLKEARPLPDWAATIWDIFNGTSRQWESGRPRQVAAVEVEAYCRLCGVELNPIEFKLLKVIDWEFIRSYG